MVTISHITHIENLSGILSAGCLWSDAKRIELGLVSRNIGYSHIKERRLRRPVTVAVGGTIGQYVPFNFCPRSVMLFVISKGHADYVGGQDEILHLISDIDTVRRYNPDCFFTDIHADLDFAEQIDDFSRIKELDLSRIINERYWQDFKEEKQAEFLAFENVPWEAITAIGVKNVAMKGRVEALLSGRAHRPIATVEPNWYY